MKERREGLRAIVLALVGAEEGLDLFGAGGLLWGGGAGGEEELDGGGVVAGFAVPTVLGAVGGPAEGGGVEFVFGVVEGGIVLEESADHGGVAVPGGPVEGGGVVLAAGGDGPAGFEKEGDGVEVVVLGGVDEGAVVFWREIFGDEVQRLEECFIACDGGGGEF